jgi:hypothetical protein
VSLANNKASRVSLRAWSIDADALGFAMLQIGLDGQREGTPDNQAIRAAAERC